MHEYWLKLNRVNKEFVPSIRVSIRICYIDTYRVPSIWDCCYVDKRNYRTRNIFPTRDASHRPEGSSDRHRTDSSLGRNSLRTGSWHRVFYNSGYSLPATSFADCIHISSRNIPDYTRKCHICTYHCPCKNFQLYISDSGESKDNNQMKTFGKWEREKKPYSIRLVTRTLADDVQFNG